MSMITVAEAAENWGIFLSIFQTLTVCWMTLIWICLTIYL